MCLQETITAAGSSIFQGLKVEASGYTENKHLGCETWLYTQNPIMPKTPNGTIVKCFIDKYVILIASPRTLLILCSLKVGLLAILNVHGPDTGKSAKDVYDFGNDFLSIVIKNGSHSVPGDAPFLATFSTLFRRWCF